MSKRQPNIILLIVDTLRYDRMGISGYRPALTPNLDRLAREGLLATNHFSNGCPTQVAFPAMFTSSLPFDYGGYNEGINNRPGSFPEVLRGAGYDTWGAVTAHPCSSHFGYDRGFNQFIELIDLHEWFRSIFKTMLRELLDRWQAGQLSDADMFAKLKATYDTCLANTERFIFEMDALRIPASGLPRAKILRDVRRERELLHRDPGAICKKIVTLDQQYMHALGEPEVTPALQARVDRRVRLRNALNKRLMLASDRRAYTAATVNKLFDKYLAARDPAKPFFAMLHFFDLHEAKLLLSHWTRDRFARLPGAFLRARKDRPRGQDGLMYDISLNMVDAQIGSLLRTLDLHGLSEDTIMVATGDHGTIAGAPRRPIVRDMSWSFYDEYIRVPLVVHGRGIEPGEIDILASHVDLGPTILDIAGLESPASFQGIPLSRRRTEPPPFVVSENAGNGRCDIGEKSLYFGIRGVRCKTVFEAGDFTARERDVFDLEADPAEQSNLVETEAFSDERSRHRAFVQDRLDCLRVANEAAH